MIDKIRPDAAYLVDNTPGAYRRGDPAFICGVDIVTPDPDTGYTGPITAFKVLYSDGESGHVRFLGYSLDFLDFVTAEEARRLEVAR